jgi:hypothetical protein
MKKNIIFLFVVIIAFLMIAISCGKDGKCCSSSSKIERMANLMKKFIACELKMDSQQKKVLDENCLDILNKGKEFEPFFENVYNSLITQIESEKFDQDQLNKMLVENQYLFDEMRSTIIQGMAKLHDNLTDAQRKKLASLIKNCYNKKQCGHN